MYRNKHFFIIFLIVSGCVSSRAPEGALPDPDVFVKKGYGAWLELQYLSGEKYTVESGEFIAIDSSNVYMLTTGKSKMIAMNDVFEAWLELQGSSQQKTVAGYTVLGILSTISHGFWLVFSAPVWLLAGTSNAAAESRADKYNQKNPPSEWWVEMRKFSRFPQGLPTGIQIESLKP